MKMRRGVKRAQSLVEKNDWVFNVGIDISLHSRARIAFLSGLERSYFPGDPGHSKFGLVFQSTGFEDESPPCTFLPYAAALVRKPISNKGYGIGGLSAPRFPPVSNQIDNPSPDKYQHEIGPRILKSRRRQVPEELDFVRLAPDDPLALKRLHDRQNQRALQCRVSFGSRRATSRFGNPPQFNTAGVGSYTGTMVNTDPTYHTYSVPSFGRTPILHQVSADVKCVFDEDEECIECGQILQISDFYRSRLSVRVPLPETRHLDTLEKKFPLGLLRHVNLCNVCYYRASLGRSKNWPKNKLRWIFKKTRTCAFIHEHQGLAEVIHKADCRQLKKLQLKETVLSKYYEDRVEESIHPKNREQ